MQTILLLKCKKIVKKTEKKHGQKKGIWNCTHAESVAGIDNSASLYKRDTLWLRVETKKKKNGYTSNTIYNLKK